MFPASLLKSKFLHLVRRIKKTVQDNLLLLGHQQRPLHGADFLNTDRETKEKIEAVYRHYTHTCSDQVFTLSLPTLFIFHNLICNWKPDIVLDLGSGLSTWVAHLAASKNQHTQVVSFDTDEQWIQTTQSFLRQMGVEQEIHLYNEFSNFKPDAGKRMLILNDIGDPKNFHVREQSLAAIEKYIAQGAMLLLDDIHKPLVKARAVDMIRQRNLRFFNLCKWTFDSFGRYAWIIHNERRV